MPTRGVCLASRLSGRLCGAADTHVRLPGPNVPSGLPDSCSGTRRSSIAADSPQFIHFFPTAAGGVEESSAAWACAGGCIVAFSRAIFCQRPRLTEPSYLQTFPTPNVRLGFAGRTRRIKTALTSAIHSGATVWDVIILGSVEGPLEVGDDLREPNQFHYSSVRLVPNSVRTRCCPVATHMRIKNGSPGCNGRYKVVIDGFEFDDGLSS